MDFITGAQLNAKSHWASLVSLSSAISDDTPKPSISEGNGGLAKQIEPHWSNQPYELNDTPTVLSICKLTRGFNIFADLSAPTAVVNKLCAVLALQHFDADVMVVCIFSVDKFSPASRPQASARLSKCSTMPIDIWSSTNRAETLTKGNGKSVTTARISSPGTEGERRPTNYPVPDNLIHCSGRKYSYIGNTFFVLAGTLHKTPVDVWGSIHASDEAHNLGSDFAIQQSQFCSEESVQESPILAKKTTAVLTYENVGVWSTSDESGKGISLQSGFLLFVLSSVLS